MTRRVRCRGKFRKMSITTRTIKIIDNSRSLSFTFAHWINIAQYHRRNFVGVQHEYGIKSPIDSVGLTKTGKTLRNRKDHVPKYKVDRCGINWTMMIFERSPSNHWRRARHKWIEHCRNIKKLETKHLDKMITTHWWKI